MQSLIDHLKLICCLPIVLVAIYCCQVMPALAVPSPARAATPTLVATPIELKISLGNTANELKFFPDRLQLVAGKKI